MKNKSLVMVLVILVVGFALANTETETIDTFKRMMGMEEQNVIPTTTPVILAEYEMIEDQTENNTET